MPRDRVTERMAQLPNLFLHLLTCNCLSSPGFAFVTHRRRCRPGILEYQQLQPAFQSAFNMADDEQGPLLSSPYSLAVNVPRTVKDNALLSPTLLYSAGDLSPAPSFASKDSFSTALSSPSQVTLAQEESPSASGSTLMPMSPSNLRKSISVDSFVNYGRDPLPATTRQHRSQTNAALESPKNLRFDSSQKMDRDTCLGGRLRGASVSSVIEERTSVAEDSDIERSEVLNSSIDDYKRTSFKGQDKIKSFVGGGELPLPSRTPALSTTSSMSSILSSSTSSSTQEGVPRMQSHSSLQSLAKKSTPAATASGRSRSGSLGMPPSSRRMMINTSVSSAAVCITIISSFPH